MKARVPFLLFLLAFLFASAAPRARAQEEVSFDYFYDNLKPYGEWVQVADYGLCWHPREVDGDWAPYTDGYWSYTDAGWTWVSYEDYGDIVYHYGRWVRVEDEGWCWVPDNDWGPAWVSWRHNDDVVGWAPLPPEAHFRTGVGIGVWADETYDIGPGYYRFCQVSDFGAPVIAAVCLPRARNVVFFGDTVNITNITYNTGYGVPFCGGPRYDFISTRVLRPIPTLKLVRETNITNINININNNNRRSAFASVQRGNTLVVPAPRIRAVANRNAPVPNLAPARVLGADRVGRGWGEVKTSQERDQLRQVVKQQNKGATPETAPARAFNVAEVKAVPQKADPDAPSQAGTGRKNGPGKGQPAVVGNGGFNGQGGGNPANTGNPGKGQPGVAGNGGFNGQGGGNPANTGNPGKGPGVAGNGGNNGQGGGNPSGTGNSGKGQPAVVGNGGFNGQGGGTPAGKGKGAAGRNPANVGIPLTEEPPVKSVPQPATGKGKGAKPGAAVVTSPETPKFTPPDEPRTIPTAPRTAQPVNKGPSEPLRQGKEIPSTSGGGGFKQGGAKSGEMSDAERQQRSAAREEAARQQHLEMQREQAGREQAVTKQADRPPMAKQRQTDPDEGLKAARQQQQQAAAAAARQQQQQQQQAAAAAAARQQAASASAARERAAQNNPPPRQFQQPQQQPQRQIQQQAPGRPGQPVANGTPAGKGKGKDKDDDKR